MQLRLVIPEDLVPYLLKELGPLADSRAGREAGINNLLIRCMRSRYGVDGPQAGVMEVGWTQRGGKMAETARAILAAVDAGIHDRQQIMARLYGRKWRFRKEAIKHADSVATRLRNSGDLDANASPQWRRPPRESGLTPAENFRPYLIATMRELRGRGGTSKIKDVMYQKVKDFLTPRDVEEDGRAGEKPNWWRTVNFLRLQLVREGIFKADSPSGIWELNPPLRRAA
jgi:hypothetical protein